MGDPLRVYVAASALEIDRAKRAMAALRAAGVEVTSTWVQSIEAVGVSNPRDASVEQRMGWAATCFDEIRRAHLVWLLAPAKNAPTRGAWAEFGFAHASGKGIVSSGDTKQSIFTALWEEHETDEAALRSILEEQDRYLSVDGMRARYLDSLGPRSGTIASAAVLFVPDGKPCCARIGSVWCWRVDEHAVPGECEGAEERSLPSNLFERGRVKQ